VSPWRSFPHGGASILFAASNTVDYETTTLVCRKNMGNSNSSPGDQTPLSNEADAYKNNRSRKRKRGIEPEESVALLKNELKELKEENSKIKREGEDSKRTPNEEVRNVLVCVVAIFTLFAKLTTMFSSVQNSVGEGRRNCRGPKEN
jgi:hypothetical protein